MSDQLFENNDLLELGSQLDAIYDRMDKGEEYVAAHPEDARGPGMLGHLKLRWAELARVIYSVTAWETVTFTFNYPEDDEFGDKPPFVVYDGQAAVRKDENGARVIDVTYTRPQLNLLMKLLGGQNESKRS